MPAAKLFGEPSRLIQMYSIANMRIYFGITKIIARKTPCRSKSNDKEFGMEYSLIIIFYNKYLLLPLLRILDKYHFLYQYLNFSTNQSLYRKEQIYVW